MAGDDCSTKSFKGEFKTFLKKIGVLVAPRQVNQIGNIIFTVSICLNVCC